MTISYSTIATGGKRFKPMLVKKIVNQNGEVVREFRPELIRDVTVPDDDEVVVSKSTLDVVREAMRRVANGEHGTARWWKIPGIEMAGKTGTSQVMAFSADDIYSRCENRPILQRHHGSYIAFAPFNNPEIVVGALTEHACHGNVGASPVVRDVILAYMKKYHPELITQKGAKNVEPKAQVSENQEIDE
ncbi:MAG: penicillin-binding transpeptidase domain-containing protein [Bdellovibrionales bacterium]